MTEIQKTQHSYDGIEEFDNPLPAWWTWLFVISIAFCPFYWIYFHSNIEGRSIHDQHELAVAENSRLQFAQMGMLDPDRETIVRCMNDEDLVTVGRIVFKANCVVCHGRSGEGKVGSNLTDNFYKNVQNIEDIATVIAKGANGNAMPAWASRLHPNEVVLVAAYVASLRDTNVENGKMKEGRESPPWPEPPSDDGESSDSPGKDNVSAGDGGK